MCLRDPDKWITNCCVGEVCLLLWRKMIMLLFLLIVLFIYLAKTSPHNWNILGTIGKVWGFIHTKFLQLKANPPRPPWLSSFLNPSLQVSLQWSERMTAWMLQRPATSMTRARSTARHTSAPAPAESLQLKSATRGSATRPFGSSLTRQGASVSGEKHPQQRFPHKSWIYSTEGMVQGGERFLKRGS